jgi:hypothetical protein
MAEAKPAPPLANQLANWQQLLGPDAGPLREAAGEIDPEDVRAVARLRARWPAELVSLALELAGARRKAQAKFPEQAPHLVADRESIEQATAYALAQYKAGRISGCAPNGPVVDLACGVGGDALAMQEAGLRPRAVDRNPVRAWMTRQNVGCPAAAADVADLQLSGWLCHLDPARRSERGRSRSLHQSEPGPETVQRVEQRAAGLALKLSPAVDPEQLPFPGELEFISDHGRLVQSVLWSKALAGATSRRATRLERGETHTLAGEPSVAPVGGMRDYLFTLDPAIERAALAGPLCEQLQLESIHPKLGLLTGGEAITSPWLRGFALQAHMPWRPKRVKQWLNAHDAGLIEVKTRGRAVNPDIVQKQLRGQGQTPYTVFILRWDTHPVALITSRLDSRSSDAVH